MARLLLSLLVLGLLASAGAAFAEDAKPKPAPEVGKELSTVEGVSIVRQPFSFFGSSSMSMSQAGEGGNVSVRGESISLDAPIESLLPVPASRFFPRFKLPGGRYNVTAKGDTKEAAFEKLAQAYEAAFGARLVKEEREVPVLVLRDAPGEAKLKLPEIPAGEEEQEEAEEREFGGVQMTDTSFNANGTLMTIGHALEGWLRQPVISDSKDARSYRLAFKVRRGHKLEDCRKALGEFGLELVDDKQKLEGVFLEPAEM